MLPMRPLRRGALRSRPVILVVPGCDARYTRRAIFH